MKGDMTKAELVDEVAAKADLSKADAKAAVDAFLETVEETLAAGKDVSFPGFGKFAKVCPRCADDPGPLTFRD